MKKAPPATGAASERAPHIFALLSNGGDAKASLRRVFREDSCINSTSVLFEVFRAFGGRPDLEGKVAGDLVRYLKSKGVRAHG